MMFFNSLHRVAGNWCALSPKGPGGSQLQVEVQCVSLSPAVRHHVRNLDGAVVSTHSRGSCTVPTRPAEGAARDTRTPPAGR